MRYTVQTRFAALLVALLLIFCCAPSRCRTALLITTAIAALTVSIP